MQRGIDYHTAPIGKAWLRFSQSASNWNMRRMAESSLPFPTFEV